MNGMLYQRQPLVNNDRISSVQRFFAWCIDSILIVCLYLVFLYLWDLYILPYLGALVVLLITAPSSYPYINSEALYNSMWLIIWYCIVNALYYILCGLLMHGGSIGLKIVCRGYKIYMHHPDDVDYAVLYKSICIQQFLFLVLVLCTSLLVYLIGIAYIWSILLNLLILYAPIKGEKHQSCLEIMTSTYYVKIKKRRNEYADKDYVEVKDTKMNLVSKKMGYFFQKKEFFPFNSGINRLFIVLWIGASLWMEFSYWHIGMRERSIYGMGLIPFFLIPILYFAIVWIYNGFKNNKSND